MYETIYLLSKSKIIENFEIINFVVEEDLQLLNVKCFLVDESVLYIRDVIISVQKNILTIGRMGRENLLSDGITLHIIK